MRCLRMDIPWALIGIGYLVKCKDGLCGDVLSLASRGFGKTLIKSHLVAYCSHQAIDRALVHAWRRTLQTRLDSVETAQYCALITRRSQAQAGKCSAVLTHDPARPWLGLTASLSMPYIVMYSDSHTRAHTSYSADQPDVSTTKSIFRIRVRVHSRHTNDSALRRSQLQYHEVW